MSFATDSPRTLTVPVSTVFATSSRMNVTRFVTGNPQVTWPPVNTVTGEFVIAGQETEALFSDWSRVRTAVYQTVESVYGYTEAALNDPTYGTAAFFTGASLGLAPYTRYQSVSAGSFSQAMNALFATALQNVDATTIFTVEQALATQNTALYLLARNNA